MTPIGWPREPEHNVVKLFYEQHYSCYSKNWGVSKGQDHYVDVCVVLNVKAWKQDPFA